MVSVPARREQVAYAMRRGLSQRRSCGCLIPARFQLARHQPVGRAGRVVLAGGAVSLIASRFEIACERLTPLISPVCRFPLGSNRRLDRTGPPTARRASSMASSTRSPPKAMQRGSPLSSQPRLQL